MSQEESVKEVRNESNVSMSYDRNSRGYTTKVHVYSNASKKEIEECAWKTVYGDSQLDEHIKNWELLKRNDNIK